MRSMYFHMGGHVYLAVRHAAVVDFWLPDFRGLDQSHVRKGEGQEWWSARASAFSDSAEYVAERLRSIPLAIQICAAFTVPRIHIALSTVVRAE